MQEPHLFNIPNPLQSRKASVISIVGDRNSSLGNLGDVVLDYDRAAFHGAYPSARQYFLRALA